MWYQNLIWRCRTATRKDVGMKTHADIVLQNRASFTSVVTARSSDSRMARASLSSSSARTPVVLHGLFFSEDNTRRVSLRYDHSSWGGIGLHCAVAVDRSPGGANC